MATRWQVKVWSAALALGCGGAASDGDVERAATDVAPGDTRAEGEPDAAPGADAVAAVGGDTEASSDGVADSLGERENPAGLPPACPTPLALTLATARGGLDVRCQGQGPDVLLMHGLGEDPRGMATLADALAPTHRTVALDWSRRDDLTLGALADDVGAVLDAMGHPATVVGADAGALVAWYAADRYPDRVAHVLAVDVPHPDAVAAEPQGTSRWVEQVGTVDGLRALVADEALADVLAPSWAVAPPARFFEANWDGDAWAPLAPVGQPALVALRPGTLDGLGDPLFTPRALVGLDSAAPASQALLFPGASGALERSRAAELAAAVAALEVGAAPAETLGVPAGVGGVAADLGGLPELTAVVDEDGKPVTAADFTGRIAVLWFYPKAATFG